jgi:hypothetical protein
MKDTESQLIWEAMQKAKKSNEEPIEDNSTETVAPSAVPPQEKPKPADPGPGPARQSQSPYRGARGPQHKFF